MSFTTKAKISKKSTNRLEESLRKQLTQEEIDKYEEEYGSKL